MDMDIDEEFDRSKSKSDSDSSYDSDDAFGDEYWGEGSWSDLEMDDQLTDGHESDEEKKQEQEEEEEEEKEEEQEEGAEDWGQVGDDDSFGQAEEQGEDGPQARDLLELEFEGCNSSDDKSEHELAFEDEFGVSPDYQASLQARVWSKVLERLNAENHEINVFSRKDISFILPGVEDNGPGVQKSARMGRQSATAWDRLLEKPILVSDEDLALLMGLETSTQDSPQPEKGATVFYMRTFSLKVSQLRQLILEWESGEVYFHQSKIWWEATRSIEGDPLIYLRYVGMTLSGTTWRRHQKHLKGQKSHILDAFIDIIQHRFPEVFETIKVYEFTEGRMEALSMFSDQAQAKKRRDFRERALIALFDRQTLLNVQSGGFHNDYVPKEVEVKALEGLGLQNFRLLLDVAKPNKALDRNIQTWANKKLDLANRRPIDTGTKTIPLTCKWISAIRSQAMPWQYKQQTIVVSAGGDAGVSQIRSEKGFWAGKSPSAALLKQLLKATAIGGGSSTPEPDCEAFCSLPWVELFSWARPGCLSEAIDSLRSYYQLTLPVLTIGYGKNVCSVITSGFTDDLGYSARDHFLPSVGKLNIVQYGTRPEETTILIPCLHPGRDKQRDRPAAFRRVLIKTLWIALLSIQFTIEAIECNLGTDRLQLCIHIKARTTDRLRSTGFMRAYQDDKTELATFLMRTNRARHIRASDGLEAQCDASRRYKLMVNIASRLMAQHLIFAGADGTLRGRQGTLRNWP
jgi:hypothetical protein